MRTRSILSLTMAAVMAMTAVSVGTVTLASPGHHDDGHQESKKDKQKAKKNTKKARPAAVQASASIGVLGTQEAPRDIAITMTDELRFDPGTIAVHQGETIRFLIENPTIAPHDFTLGDMDAQMHHHEEMSAGNGHAHGDTGEGGLPGAVALDPGASAEVIATFDEAGEILVGCHVPGHWEAGMRGSIVIMGAGLVLGTQEAPRDIAITMTDELRFDPGTIAVHQGETIRFLIENPTVAPHDFTLGDMDAQMHHHEEMSAGNGHAHGETGEDALPGAVALDPGASAEVIATFDEAGEILVGCHVPGHWEAGMRGSLMVMPGGVPDTA